jgi:hypothetical protein
MPDTDDAVDMLLEQHGLIREMFGQVHDADRATKAKLFGDLVYLLEAHETGEQQTVHAVMRDQVADGADVAEARVAEETEANRALAELKAIGIDDPGFDEKFDMFHQAVLAHAAHEEDDEFPRLRQLIPAEQLHMMAGELQSIQAMQ